MPPQLNIFTSSLYLLLQQESCEEETEERAQKNSVSQTRTILNQAPKSTKEAGKRCYQLMKEQQEVTITTGSDGTERQIQTAT